MENKVKCSICEKEYYKRGILTHMMRMHGTKEQKSLFVCAGNGPALAAIRLKYDARIADYDAHPAKCKNLAGCSTVKIYVRPQGRSPCGDVSYVVIICPCLGISFSASAESSVSPLPEAV